MAKVSVKVDVSELVDLAKKFEEFFDPSIAKPSPLGKAVAAGARGLYFELQNETPVNKDGSAKDPGLLRDSVYRHWDEAASPDGNHITYNVGVNLKKAPHFHLANDGHAFYTGYPPLLFSKDPLVIRSFKKDPSRPKGNPYMNAKPHHYLDRVFNESNVRKALQVVFDEYVHQFNETVGRK